MAKDYEQLWKGIPSAKGEAQVRSMAEIVAEKEGRVFLLSLGCKDAVLCIRVLDHVSRSFDLHGRYPRWSCQGITGHDFAPSEKHAFFLTLRRLAEHHGRLPDRMVITEGIEISDEVLASSGFADIRSGTYMGHRVAVKTIRVTAQDNFLKIRKVSINFGHPECGLTIPLRDFARKLSCGARCPIRTSRSLLGSGATWRKDNS